MRALTLLFLFTIWLFGEAIESYHTDLVVLNNQKVVVTEDITYNFGTIRKHGIYRDIPKNKTKLENLKVTQNGYPVAFKLFRKKEYYRIRIGDPNYYVTGVVRYKISYNLEGKVVRKLNQKNAIIFDFIGTGWSVPIKEASGRLFLPKELQKGSLEIEGFRGRFGSKEPIKITRSGSLLEFHTYNLQPKEGVTLLVAFDPSLMEASKEPSSPSYKNPLYYLFFAPILALFYYFAKEYNLFGDIGSIAPRYRPPKELTILEAGLLKDNFVDFEELKAAIIELANLGYLKIEKIDSELYLKKLPKERSALSLDQQRLLEEIFSVGELVPNSQIRVEKGLFERLKEGLHQSLVDKGYFGSKVSTARQLFLFAATALGLLTLAGFFYYTFRESGYEALIPAAVASFFIMLGVVNFIAAYKSKSISTMLFFSLWILFSLLFLATSLQSKDLLISIGLMVLVIAVGGYIIYRGMNTLTLKGVLAKRHLLGLKEFIERAERDKIKFFLKEDPRYLDKLLPYAVLFGLNKHWLKLYQELNSDLPEWYEGDFSNFSSLDFNPRYYSPESNQFDGFTPNDISINPGDFGDFGGFSGGGFGGGGGGSW